MEYTKGIISGAISLSCQLAQNILPGVVSETMKMALQNEKIANILTGVLFMTSAVGLVVKFDIPRKIKACFYPSEDDRQQLFFPNGVSNKIRISSSKTNEDEGFPLDEVRKACQLWMNTFLKDFDPSKVKKYKIEQLYLEDVVSSNEETETMQGIYKTLWSELGIELGEYWWNGEKEDLPEGLPEGWKKHSGSYRSCNVENPKYPGYIFKFSSKPPASGVPAAHFLRIPKGKEIQRIVNEEKLDELEIVDERLIALKSQDEIKEKREDEQCYHFVVKSKKINLLDKRETISMLSSLPQQKQIKIATQIMRMICKSGLGDVGFHNFNINKKTGKLVIIDTEPLFGSLLLDEKSQFNGQYRQNDEMMARCTNSRTVTVAINKMIQACERLPVFEKIAKVYRECFEEGIRGGSEKQAVF